MTLLFDLETSSGQFPLDAGKYQQWAEAALLNGPLLNLFMDYETFGEHQWGRYWHIRVFEDLIGRWVAHPEYDFYTVSGAAAAFEPAGELSIGKSAEFVSVQCFRMTLSAFLRLMLPHTAAAALLLCLCVFFGVGKEKTCVVITEQTKKPETSGMVYYLLLFLSAFRQWAAFCRLQAFSWLS